MTLDEVQKLSSPELRVKIAELLGYSGIHQNDYRGPQGTPPNCSVCTFLPDFPNDLNAMNEAENLVKDDPKYYRNLYAATASGLGSAIRATARERANAFLLTFLA